MTPMTRVRIRYTKTGKVRFTSHRDTCRVWERTFRKAGVRVAYTQGYAPRPKLHFGLALPTGYESRAEYLDADLIGVAQEPDWRATLPGRLTAALPAGMSAPAVAELLPGSPSLQEVVTSCSWRIEVVDAAVDDLAAAVDWVLATPSLPLTRQRKGREITDDIRPYVIGLALAGPTARGTELIAELGTQPRALRPSELLAGLAAIPGVPTAQGVTWEIGLVTRTHQWIEHAGVRQEPLTLAGDALPAPHAEARAS